MLQANEVISKTLLTIDQYKGNLKSFKHAISEGEYAPTNDVFSRLLLWKVCLITDSLNIQNWESTLSQSRVIYHQLAKQHDMIIPWWKLSPDSAFYQSKEVSRASSVKRARSVRRTASLKKSSLRKSIDVADPLQSLSLSPSSSTKGRSTSSISESDEELLDTIILDVERLFPGEEFYHSPNQNALTSKRQIISILYVWSKCNPHVRYKQGFHEILGLIYYNLHKESVVIPSSNTLSKTDFSILNLFDLHYLCHDAFTIFNKFMLQSGIISSFYENEDVLWKSIESFNVYLMKVDQLIHYNLISKLKLESQLWIIRYLRLLLLREFGNDLKEINLIWDKLITIQPKHHNEDPIKAIPDIVIFMIIVLLIRLKSELIVCDFGESLSLLLHYPTLLKSSSLSKQDFSKGLVSDALALYEIRNDDLKLYEYGIKLNAKFNPNLKITMSFNGSRTKEGQLNNSSPRPSIDTRAEQLKFEKYRLEMRLKKKAQQLLSRSS
ncbi:uncharacterized protein PRCAT00006189001 [Priceomyces carsonii]|uniref:uncharacterized protein n=1 Tax=Priceomyces carsonii TaxID=28549 RepID=UPI002ED95309|nr:unnamed protein product [Priceomyces carsonii]